MILWSEYLLSLDLLVLLLGILIRLGYLNYLLEPAVLTKIEDYLEPNSSKESERRPVVFPIPSETHVQLFSAPVAHSAGGRCGSSELHRICECESTLWLGLPGFRLNPHHPGGGRRPRHSRIAEGGGDLFPVCCLEK